MPEHGGGGLRLVDNAHGEIGFGQALQRLLGLAGVLIFEQHFAEAVDRRGVIVSRFK